MSIYVKRNGHKVDPAELLSELNNEDVKLKDLQESEWSIGVLETKLKLSYGDGLDCEYEPHELDCETDWLEVERTNAWHVKWHILRYDQNSEIELPQPWFADDDDDVEIDLKRPDTQTFTAWVSWSGGHSLDDLLSCTDDGPLAEDLIDLIEAIQDLIDNGDDEDV